MKMTVKNRQAATLGILLGLSAIPAHAALEIRAGGTMVYDTDLDITWLADANYASTSGYDADGLMDWSAANIWAETLVFGGYDDWRLPTTLPEPPLNGYDLTESEMGHLFYEELGGIAHEQLSITHDADYDLFSNIQAWVYWSGTIYSPDTNNAWNFRFEDQYSAYSAGLLTWNTTTFEFYAWAVRSGDVAVVPVPAAMWLLGSGLVGLIGIGRRKVPSI